MKVFSNNKKTVLTSGIKVILPVKMKKVLFTLGCCLRLSSAILLLMLMLALNTHSADIPSTFSDVVGKVKSGVVNISTTKIVKQKMFPDIFQDEFFKKFFGDEFQDFSKPREFKSKSLGSGFIVDAKNGYIVTNNHVIDRADEIIVRLSDKHEFTAKVVGTDPLTDLALLKIDIKNVTLQSLPLGNSDTADVGDWVLAIGNPFGLEWSVTAGIISAKERLLGAGPYDDFMQTDASINPGNSGGPLVNLRGEVIGINTAIIPAGQGLGFAIPVNIFKDLYPKLIKGKIVRGWLGVVVQPLDEKLSKSFGLKGTEGALIADVVENDPADKAGIKPGDVVIEINGKKIYDHRELTNMIGKMTPGQIAKLTVIRNGQKKIIDVRLGERKDDRLVAKSDIESDSPIVVEDLTDQEKRSIGVTNGVKVVRVDESSNAYEAGLREGDVVVWLNRRDVLSKEMFYNLYSNIEKGAVVALKIVSPQGGRFIAFDKD